MTSPSRFDMREQTAMYGTEGGSMSRRACRCLIVIMTVLIIGVHPSCLWAQDVWIETTQEDFRDGFFDRDIYASQRDGGTVEFSLRWDLNNDEYIDIPMARTPRLRNLVLVFDACLYQLIRRMRKEAARSV